MISIERIQAEVADFFGISLFALKGKTRPDAIAFPRQVAMYMCVKNGFTYSKIAEGFNLHSDTIRHGCRAVKKRINRDSNVKSDVLLVEIRILSDRLLPQVEPTAPQSPLA